MGREVGELPAGAWTGFVDHAEIAIEEYASVFGMPQHVLPVLQIGDRVVPDDLLWQYIQVSRKSFNIFAGNVHPGIAATISANLAVDLLLHLLGDPAKQTFAIMVSFQIAPKVEILICLRLREITDLDEVGDHALSILLLPPAGSPKACSDVNHHALNVDVVQHSCTLVERARK